MMLPKIIIREMCRVLLCISLIYLLFAHTHIMPNVAWHKLLKFALCRTFWGVLRHNNLIWVKLPRNCWNETKCGGICGIISTYTVFHGKKPTGLILHLTQICRKYIKRNGNIKINDWWTRWRWMTLFSAAEFLKKTAVFVWYNWLETKNPAFSGLIWTHF